MRSLSIIGCGKVGKVLGRLFHKEGLFEIRDLLNRSTERAEEAAAFIGAGRAVTCHSQLRPADLFLIAVSDDAIAVSAARLADSGLVLPGVIVWHVSGSLPSSILSPVSERGGEVASVHPVKSFADPASSVATFHGTWCGIEGDQGAVALLSEAFGAVGGRIFSVDGRFKTIYHAGSVMVCNYLTALMEVGLRCFEKGGLERETALQVMEPLVRGTVENIFSRGTEAALTGPIARGDAAVVSAQLAAVEGWDPEVAAVYRALGGVALELATRRGDANEGHQALRDLLCE